MDYESKYVETNHKKRLKEPAPHLRAIRAKLEAQQQEALSKARHHSQSRVEGNPGLGWDRARELALSHSDVAGEAFSEVLKRMLED